MCDTRTIYTLPRMVTRVISRLGWLLPLPLSPPYLCSGVGGRSDVIITVSNYQEWNKMPFSSKLQNVPLISLRVNAFSDCTFPRLAELAGGCPSRSFTTFYRICVNERRSFVASRRRRRRSLGGFAGARLG